MPQLVTMGVLTYRLPNKHKRPQETTFMKMIRTSLKSAIALGVLSTGFIASTHTAHAQSANEARKWVKVCSKVGESDICNVQFNIVTPNNQLVTGVNLLQSKGKTTRRIFQVAVPSGRYIPEGIKVQIDKGKTNTLPYSICLPDRCLAEVQLSEGLVKALKGGGEIVLTSTNYRAQKNPVKVTLKGFTAAFDGPPLKRGEVAERNKKIEEGLKLKAKETADKLKAAQDAAKQGSN